MLGKIIIRQVISSYRISVEIEFISSLTMDASSGVIYGWCDICLVKF